jgi:hypothetical protein
VEGRTTPLGMGEGGSPQCSLLGVRELIYAARCIMGSHCYANHSSLFTVLRIVLLIHLAQFSLFSPSDNIT